MIGNTLLLALTLFIAFCFLLMDRLKFLAPYRQAIFHDYGWAIALYSVLLFGKFVRSVLPVSPALLSKTHRPETGLRGQTTQNRRGRSLG